MAYRILIICMFSIMYIKTGISQSSKSIVDYYESIEIKYSFDSLEKPVTEYYSVDLYFDYVFTDDTIKIFKNQQLLLEESISTSETLALAKYFKIKDCSDEDIIGVQINSKQIVLLKIDNLQKAGNQIIIRQPYEQNKLLILISSIKPEYY